MQEKKLLRTEPKKQGSRIWKSCLLALLLLFSFYLVHVSPLGRCFHLDGLPYLQKELARFQFFAPLAFLFVSIISISIGIPRSIISFLAGGLLGIWLGLLISIIAALAGSTITFFYVTWTQKNFFPKFEKESERFRTRYIRNREFLAVFLLRQVPAPGVIINIICALTRIRLKTFIFASVLGFLPQCIIFNLYGSAFIQKNIYSLIIASLLVLVIALAVYFMRNFHRSFFDSALCLVRSSQDNPK